MILLLIYKKRSISNHRTSDNIVYSNFLFIFRLNYIIVKWIDIQMLTWIVGCLIGHRSKKLINNDQHCVTGCVTLKFLCIYLCLLNTDLFPVL